MLEYPGFQTLKRDLDSDVIKLRPVEGSGSGSISSAVMCKGLDGVVKGATG